MSRYFNDYIAHYGTLGMKWGVRRYQNADGTLTAAGKNRYGTESAVKNVGRALLNTSIGQRVAVNVNKGYRADKKDIKDKSSNLKRQIKSSNTSRSIKREKLKNLKTDTKKTFAEARTAAQTAIYPWQSDATNEKIQSQSVGKAFVKSFLAGAAGSLYYDRNSTKSGANKKQIAAVSGLIGLLDGATMGAVSGIVTPMDYAFNKIKYDKQHSDVKNKKNNASSKDKSMSKPFDIKIDKDKSMTLVRNKRATFKQKRNLKKARNAAAAKRASDAEKERLVNYGSASELSQHLNELSNEQKQRAITRLDLDSKIMGLSDTEKSRQKSKVDKLLDTGVKVSKGIATAATIASNVQKLQKFFNDDDSFSNSNDKNTSHKNKAAKETVEEAVRILDHNRRLPDKSTG